jgi:hypothetical protein
MRTLGLLDTRPEPGGALDEAERDRAPPGAPTQGTKLHFSPIGVALAHLWCDNPKLVI